MSAETRNDVLRYRVGGMDCAGRAAKIERALERHGGVSDLRVNAATGTITLRIDERVGSRADIERKVTKLGYSIVAEG